MATMVETYECTELQPEGVEMTDEMREAARLAEELGLEGQTAYYQNTDEGTPKERLNPYRNLTQEERNVYVTLFPSFTKLDRYSAGPVPLRVLQVAAYAKTIGLECWVMAPRGSVKDDPVLVGVAGTTSYLDHAPTDKVFLLARWGDCLLPFETLCEKARKVLFDNKRRKLIEVKGEVAQALAGLDEGGPDTVDLSHPDARGVAFFNAW